MDAPEVDPCLHRAAQALRERQVLFRYCAEEVATARHNAMFQRYGGTAVRQFPSLCQHGRKPGASDVVTLAASAPFSRFWGVCEG